MKDLLWNMSEQAVKASMEKLTEMRTIEGKKLAEDIKMRCGLLREYIDRIEEYSETVVVEYKRKINFKNKRILR